MKNLLYIHIPKTGGISMRTNKNVTICKHNLAKDINNLKDYFSFCFIRNPYDRFLSSYCFYLTNYFGNRSINDDIQYIPQYKFVTNDSGENIVNYLGFFENLDFHWKTVCDLTDNKYYELPILNKTEHDNWKNVYTDEMKNIVYEMFKEDFKMFNYKIN